MPGSAVLRHGHAFLPDGLDETPVAEIEWSRFRQFCEDHSDDGIKAVGMSLGCMAGQKACFDGGTGNSGMVFGSSGAEETLVPGGHER